MIACVIPCAQDNEAALLEEDAECRDELFEEATKKAATKGKKRAASRR